MTSLCLNIAFKSDIQQARFSIIIKNNSYFYYPLYFDLYYLHFTFMSVTHVGATVKSIFQVSQNYYFSLVRAQFISHTADYFRTKLVRPLNVLLCLSRAGLYCFSVNVSSSAGTGVEQLIMSKTVVWLSVSCS